MGNPCNIFIEFAPVTPPEF